MKNFFYVTSDASGVHEKGNIFATDEAEAREELSNKGLEIITIRQDVKSRLKFWEKPHMSFEDKMMFTKHMSTMIQVGITITEALDIIASQLSTASSRKMFDNILKMVKSGQTLSKSLKQQGGVFSDIFVNMIAVGEESGTLDKSLGYLDKQLEKEYELKKRVISAFVYPSIIIGMTLLLTIGIVLFVMPKITDIFKTFDVKLPLPTRVLIGFSDFVVGNPILAILIIGATVGFLFFIFHVKYLKPFFHRISLYMPIFGKLLRNVNLARFTRTLNSLLVAGVTVNRALEIAGNTMSNSVYTGIILNAKAKVEQGGELGESFYGYPGLFPPLLTRMLIVGEKTGSLEVTTEHLAALYERNVDTMTRNLTVLLEPVLLVFMAVLVGGVAISIILPIYQLSNVIQS